MTEEADLGIVFDRLESLTCKQCGCEIDVAELEPFTAIQCPRCARQETVPGRLGQFLLLGLISTGGMGGVYHALDESLGRHVAVKVMLKSLGEDKAFVENFKREARSAAQLNHPNIAQIYSFGKEKGQPYIVMELVRGEGLDKMIQEGRGLDQALVLRIGLDIAGGLKAADEIGLVHGDIKPENILLDEKKRAKLVDFGIAQFEGQARGEGVWGTPYYIAPEKVRQRPSDSRTDIYSLGATLYHALAGVPPFEGETPLEVVKARLEQAAPPLQEARPDINEQVAATLARMLEASPAMRYPTYASLISDLTKALKAVSPKPAHGLPGGATGKKVIIKKRSPSVILSSQGERRSAGGGGQIAPRQITVRRREQQGVMGPPKPRKRSPKLKVVLWVILFVLLSMVIARGYISFRDKRYAEMEERRRVYELKQALESVEESVAVIVVAATNVVKLVPKIGPPVARTREAAAAVLGDSLNDYDLSPLPLPGEKPPPGKEKPEQREGDAGEKAAAEPDGDEAPSQEDAEPDGDEAPSQEDAEPDGDETPSQEDAEPDAAAEDDAPAGEEEGDRQPDDDSGEAAGEAEDKDEKPPPAADDPELVRLVRQAVTQGALVRTNGAAAAGIAADARAARAAALEQTDLAGVRVETEGLAGQAELLERYEEQIVAAIAKAESLAAKAEELRRQDDRKKEEDRRLEEARRKEEARRELVAQELQRAKNAQQNTTLSVQTFKFKEALEAVSAGHDQCQTEEGKAAFKLIMDRYTYLVGLMDFLIEMLNKDPYNWGWVRGPRAAEDILGADEHGVKLKGRTVPWGQVKMSQLFRIIEHYLSNPRLKRTQRGTQNFAVAVFCAENALRKAVPGYLDKAVRLVPRLEEEIERHFPEGEETRENTEPEEEKQPPAEA
jgi:hypothetical protein